MGIGHRVRPAEAMATTRCTWVVSYDVADDKRRARVARRLQARGQRVQWSVFELLCTEAELNALLEAGPPA